MSEFEIVVGELRWSKTAHGRVSLRAHTARTSWAYPTADWDDFVGVVLGWWAAEAASLVRDPGRVARWTFMDGPYAVELHDEGGMWVFGVAADRRGPAPASRVAVWPADVVAGLDAAITQVEEAYRRAAWPLDRDMCNTLDARARLRADLAQE